MCQLQAPQTVNNSIRLEDGMGPSKLELLKEYFVTEKYRGWVSFCFEMLIMCKSSRKMLCFRKIHRKFKSFDYLNQIVSLLDKLGSFIYAFKIPSDTLYAVHECTFV